MPRGEHKIAGQAERAARYAELRDQGATPWDAAAETGVSDSTRKRYERWYRSQRGLPRREQGRWWTR